MEVHVSAPIGGINTVAAGVSMPATDSIYSYNLIGGEYGLRSRLGWREHVTGLDGQVRSILPFVGSSKDGSANRMFACTSTGIWNVSASTVTPTRVVTFSTQNDDSGWGSSTVMVTAAGHFLCYCDEANGYYVYDQATSTWTAGGPSGAPVTGADPTKLVAVIPWKNRLWLVERDTAKAWYLGLGAVGGAATEFNFGQRFQAGGDLRTLASWTYDGGAGIDDALVAVSGGGDIVIYKGTDPSSASTFALSGVWRVGAVPAGRRLTTDVGGELLVLTSTGIQPLSKLTRGALLAPTQYETGKISNLFNQLMASTSSLRGWAMRQHPLDAAMVVLVPVAPGQPTQQLAMSLSTKGWHIYRDMPMGVCAEAWGGTLYFGTEDGRVCANDGYVDGVLLASPGSHSPINWSLLTGFSNLDSPKQKRVHAIRPTILSQGGSVSHEAQAKFRWDLTEMSPPDNVIATSGSVWDTALWDVATWGGAYQAQQVMFGATGVGPEVAIAIRGAASSRMTLTGIDVRLELGGFR